MALPIWAEFLDKVMSDPKLHFSERPFERPAGVYTELNCDEENEERPVTIPRIPYSFTPKNTDIRMMSG